jgi:hypothetical protein
LPRCFGPCFAQSTRLRTLAECKPLVVVALYVYDAPMTEPVETDDLEVIDSSGRYALTLGLAGYVIWNLDAPANSDPVATYPVGEVGFESAWDRYLELGRAERKKKYRPIRILYTSAIVAEIVWVIVGLFSTFTYYRVMSDSTGGGSAFMSFSINNVLRFQMLDQVIYHIAIGFLAILLTIWVGRVLTAPEPVRPLRLPKPLLG